MIPGSIPGFVLRHEGRTGNTVGRDVTPDSVARFNPLDAWGREEFCSEVAQILIGARPEERIHLSGIEHRRGENRCGAGRLQDGRRVPPAHQVGLTSERRGISCVI